MTTDPPADPRAASVQLAHSLAEAITDFIERPDLDVGIVGAWLAVRGALDGIREIVYEA